jgi:hypothetical protein
MAVPFHVGMIHVCMAIWDLFCYLSCLEGVQEWRLSRVSCFRTDQDGPATSDDGSGLNYLAQSESSWASEAKDNGTESSSGEVERNSNEWGWFVRVQKVSLIFVLPPSFFVIWASNLRQTICYFCAGPCKKKPALHSLQCNMPTNNWWLTIKWILYLLVRAYHKMYCDGKFVFY